MRYLLFIIALFFLNCQTKKESANDLLKIKIIEKYIKNEQNQIAQDDLLQLLKTQPNNDYAWALLGRTHIKLDQDSLAHIAYDKTLSLNPNSLEAFIGKGILARRINDLEKATSYYTKVIQKDPTYAQAYSSLVAIKIKQKKYDDAVSLGLKSYQLDNEDPVIASNLSVTYHYMGNIKERDKFLNIAEKLGYHNIDTLKEFFQENSK